MKTYGDLLHERTSLQEERIDALEALHLDFKSPGNVTVRQSQRPHTLRGDGRFSLPVKTGKWASGYRQLEEFKAREWAKQYRQLEEFKAREGHCLVSLERQALCLWVAEQREQVDQLNPEQIEQLLDIQFPFRKGDQTWFTSWRALKDYQRANGNTYVVRQKSELFWLVEWCYLQRAKKTHGRMDAHQEFLLNEIGFEWNGLEARWQWMYTKAQSYFIEHGHWEIKRDPMLRRWCQKQCDSLIRSKLSPQRKVLLDAIHFAWVPIRPIRARNEASLAALREFYKEYGHANIPTTWPDQKLVRWLARQHSAYLRNELNLQIVDQLAKMGIVWDRSAEGHSEKMWGRRMTLLREFHRQTGHCLVPSNHKLALFMRAVKKAYANGKLSPNHVRELKQLGFESETSKKMWNRHICLLREFHRQAGHCRVPPRHKLARCLQIVREAYADNKLHPHHVKELEQLGFESETSEDKTVIALPVQHPLPSWEPDPQAEGDS